MTVCLLSGNIWAYLLERCTWTYFIYLVVSRDSFSVCIA